MCKQSHDLKDHKEKERERKRVREGRRKRERERGYSAERCEFLYL